MTAWQTVWTVWLSTFGASFLILEIIALKQKDGLTLSRFGWTNIMTHPLIHILVGVFLGWLFIHFVWKGKVI